MHIHKFSGSLTRMARYVCHQSNWGAMATISARTPILGFPFANVFSLSDGPVGESTGTPYIYATPMEISFHDLRANPQASITMSLAQVFKPYHALLQILLRRVTTALRSTTIQWTPGVRTSS